jgi:hypothetical protein
LSGGYGDNPAYIRYLHRREVGVCWGGPVTHLAEGVRTPGPDCAVGFERQAKAHTGGDGFDPAQVRYLHRCEAVGACSIAQRRLTPGPDRAVLHEGQAVAKPGGHARDPS